MRWYALTKRNFKEILRDPLSWIFMVGLPVLLFVAIEIMVKAMGGDSSQTPQFEVAHLTVSMIIFSFSFLTIFIGNTLSKDREDHFLLRLKSTPMKPIDFVLGYTISVLPFVAIQILVVILTGICFGLKLSGNLLFLFALFPVSFIFIGFGILFGSTVSSKGVGGIASIIPTGSSLLGGMFFPLALMEGGFKTFCYAFPFANAIDIGNLLLGDEIQSPVRCILVCIIYTLTIYFVSIFIFHKKLKKDSI